MLPPPLLPHQPLTCCCYGSGHSGAATATAVAMAAATPVLPPPPTSWTTTNFGQNRQIWHQSGPNDRQTDPLNLE